MGLDVEGATESMYSVINLDECAAGGEHQVSRINKPWSSHAGG